MDLIPHPDKLPENLGIEEDATNFKFSTAAIEFSLKETNLMLEALRERLRKINDKFQLGGHPLINMILQISHDKDEIKGLAKGLDRVGDFIERLDALEQRYKILEVAKEDPTWFKWAFADFSDDLEHIDKLLEVDEG